MLLTIKKIYHKEKNVVGKKVFVSGWVRSVRHQKGIFFIVINDGSTTKNLQLVVLENENCYERLEGINFGSGLSVKGVIAKSLGGNQDFELKKVEVVWLKKTDVNYPLQKKEISLEILRNFPQLRVKTDFFLNMFRLRDFVFRAVRDFFFEEGFYNVTPPVITSNDAEGAGQTFLVVSSDVGIGSSFFRSTSNLSVSVQLHLEALTQGLSKVYSINPCFRADKSHTYRHLAEFWMVEAEIVVFELKELVFLVEKLIKYVLKYVLKNCSEEILFFEKKEKKEITKKLNKIIIENFCYLDYQESLKILEKNWDIKWGDELQAVHEKFLCENFSKPVFVLNFPKVTKAFYAKENEKTETVASFDLLFPEIGELVGGGLREIDFVNLKKRAENKQSENLEWYINLRKFGFLPTGGFGLGFERLLMLISGVENIRDVVCFPCCYNSTIY